MATNGSSGVAQFAALGSATMRTGEWPRRWIDFHVHFFPDQIASRATAHLAQRASLQAHGDGTLRALCEFAALDGVELSINLPVATKAEQVRGINRLAVELNAARGRVLGFGTMHPRFPDPGEEIEFLARHGVPGIKMHPEYQEFYPDQPELLPVYEACARHGLILVFHAGQDPGYDTLHGSPRRFAEVLSIPGLTLVLSHMGGLREWGEVSERLLGRPVYLDTSHAMELPDEEFRRFIIAHGSERVLFGSDFPWVRAQTMQDKLVRLGLAPEVSEAIACGNALRLLGPRVGSA